MVAGWVEGLMSAYMLRHLDLFTSRVTRVALLAARAFRVIMLMRWGLPWPWSCLWRWRLKCRRCFFVGWFVTSRPPMTTCQEERGWSKEVVKVKQKKKKTYQMSNKCHLGVLKGDPKNKLEKINELSFPKAGTWTDHRGLKGINYHLSFFRKAQVIFLLPFCFCFPGVQINPQDMIATGD